MTKVLLYSGGMDSATFDSKQDQTIKILNLVNCLTELR